MSVIAFWILTILGGLIIVCMVVILTHSYWQDRKLHNPNIIGILILVGFALISTPHWSRMQIGTPEYGIILSKEEQELEIEGMDFFVSTYKPHVDKLSPEKDNSLIIKMNNFDISLQEYHKEPEEQERSNKFYELRDEYISTSTAVAETLGEKMATTWSKDPELVYVFYGVKIQSQPSGASIYVDGNFAGKTTNEVILVSAGEHEIKLKLNNEERIVRINPSVTSTVNVNFDK